MGKMAHRLRARGLGTLLALSIPALRGSRRIVKRCTSYLVPGVHTPTLLQLERGAYTIYWYEE